MIWEGEVSKQNKTLLQIESKSVQFHLYCEYFLSKQVHILLWAPEWETVCLWTCTYMQKYLCVRVLAHTCKVSFTMPSLLSMPSGLCECVFVLTSRHWGAHCSLKSNKDPQSWPFHCLQHYEVFNAAREQSWFICCSAHSHTLFHFSRRTAWSFVC